MTLRCEELDDLLPPHALDALEPADRLEVLDHLSECRAHDDDLAGYRFIASRLPLVVHEVTPRAALRSDVIQRFENEVRQSPSTEAAPRRVGRFAGLFQRNGLGYGLAAALLVTVAGLSAWNLTLQDDAMPDSVVTRTVEQDSMRLHLVYVPHQQVAVLELDMPAPASGYDYQLWQITADGPRSLGIVEWGRPSHAIQADLSQATAIAISLEPLGGSAQPTSAPIIIAEL